MATLSVAVVGSGPAGLYTAEALVKQAAALDPPCHVAVDVIDRLPTPYGLVRYGVAPDHPSIKSIAELRGKTISIGGPKDITRIYIERMFAPNGLKEGDTDFVFAGSTGARSSALQTGAIAATLLTVPFTATARPGRKPSPAHNRSRIPGKRDSRVATTCRTVAAETSTWSRPPVASRSNGGIKTLTMLQAFFLRISCINFGGDIGNWSIRTPTAR